MNFYWKRALMSVAIAATLMALAGVGSAQTLRIGWLASLSGPLSVAAQSETIGLQMAVDDINKSGGVLGQSIELVTRDTAGDPTKAVNFAQQLAFSDKVQFVIGPVNSGEALASTPILARAGIPNILLAVVDELTDPVKYPRAFRIVSTNQQWISTANDYALKTLKKNRIAVIADTTGFGAATAKAAIEMMSRSGVKPVYTVLLDPNKTDVEGEMNKAKEAGAEIIMAWTSSTGLLARLLNTRAEMKWNVPVIGHPTMTAPQVRQLLNKPENWENAYAPGYRTMTYDAEGKIPEATQALLEKARAQAGGHDLEVNMWWIAMGYDAVKLVEYAVKTAGSTDPAKIQKVLENTKNYPGIFAHYSWGPKERNGFPDSDMVMNAANTFKDGLFKLAPY